MESIEPELKDYNIKISIFYPGYTKTNLRMSGLSSADGEKLSEEQEKGAKDVGVVAKYFVKALIKEKRNILMEKNAIIVFYLRTLAPKLLSWILYKKFKKEK